MDKLFQSLSTESILNALTIGQEYLKWKEGAKSDGKFNLENKIVSVF